MLPVYRLLTNGLLLTQAGYSTFSRSFPLHKLLLCLQQNLVLNPFGITPCLRSGKKLAWAQQGNVLGVIITTHCTNVKCMLFVQYISLFIVVEGAMKRAKIVRNTHTAPPGSKIVLMSQVLKQTLAKTSEKLTGTNIKLHRCSESFIYLLSPLR